MESDNSSLRIPKFQFKITVGSTGSCVAVSIPLALVMVQTKELFAEGNLIYLVGAGAGLSITSALRKV